MSSSRASQSSSGLKKTCFIPTLNSLIRIFTSQKKFRSLPENLNLKLMYAICQCKLRHTNFKFLHVQTPRPPPPLVNQGQNEHLFLSEPKYSNLNGSLVKRLSRTYAVFIYNFFEISSGLHLH